MCEELKGKGGATYYNMNRTIEGKSTFKRRKRKGLEKKSNKHNKLY